jgi:hypothetical protein
MPTYYNQALGLDIVKSGKREREKREKREERREKRRERKSERRERERQGGARTALSLSSSPHPIPSLFQASSPSCPG